MCLCVNFSYVYHELIVCLSVNFSYEVATIGRLPKNIGLFYKRSS